MGEDDAVLTLVLDIDFTMIIAMEQYKYVAFGEGKHQASHYKFIATTSFAQQQHEVVIINPSRLSALLQYAYDKGVRLIILTSGCWDDDSITGILADFLPGLTEDARNYIANCTFINTLDSMAHFPDKSAEEVQQKPKTERLLKYLELYSPDKINEHHYILLDDTPEHVNAFKAPNPFKSEGILATTDNAIVDEIMKIRPDYDITGFYQETQEAIDKILSSINVESTARILQTLSPVKPSPKSSPCKRAPDQQTDTPSAKRLNFSNENTDDTFYPQGLNPELFGVIPSVYEEEEANIASLAP